MTFMGVFAKQQLVCCIQRAVNPGHLLRLKDQLTPLPPGAEEAHESLAAEIIASQDTGPGKRGCMEKRTCYSLTCQTALTRPSLQRPKAQKLFLKTQPSRE